MPHPATMFFLFTLAVIFLSWIFDIYGLRVQLPQTGAEIRVQSLLSPEGIRWMLRNAITNFTGFAPLGMVLIAMFGIGVAQHSGFIDACVRQGVKNRKNTKRIILWVIILGLLSNIVGDAGYIILLPIAATLFYSVGLNPVAGIITAYVSVSCGYSANVVLSTMDPLIARTTQEAAIDSGVYQGNTGPLCNYYFMSVSTFVIGAIIYRITCKRLIPSLGQYEGKQIFEGYKQLSRKERRAMTMAIVMGMVYGFSSGRYRSDNDVIEGLAQPMKLLGGYLVIAFFAAQMFACLEYSHLDKCVAIIGANLLSSVQADPLWTLILFILFTATINLIMVSATAKWAFMAFIFVPVFARMGIEPDMTQCAFRIGDSATNAITPFMFYMPLVLTYMQQYDKQATYGSLLKYTWRYSVYILIGWTMLLFIWYLTGLPLGL